MEWEKLTHIMGCNKKRDENRRQEGGMEGKNCEMNKWMNEWFDWKSCLTEIEFFFDLSFSDGSIIRVNTCNIICRNIFACKFKSLVIFWSGLKRIWRWKWHLILKIIPQQSSLVKTYLMTILEYLPFLRQQNKIPKFRSIPEKSISLKYHAYVLYMLKCINRFPYFLIRW